MIKATVGNDSRRVTVKSAGLSPAAERYTHIMSELSRVYDTDTTSISNARLYYKYPEGSLCIVVAGTLDDALKCMIQGSSEGTGLKLFCNTLETQFIGKKQPEKVITCQRRLLLRRRGTKLASTSRRAKSASRTHSSP